MTLQSPLLNSGKVWGKAGKLVSVSRRDSIVNSMHFCSLGPNFVILNAIQVIPNYFISKAPKIGSILNHHKIHSRNAVQKEKMESLSNSLHA